MRNLHMSMTERVSDSGIVAQAGTTNRNVHSKKAWSSAA